MRNSRILRLCGRLLILAGLSVSSVAMAQSANAPRLSGSYQIVQREQSGGDVRVRLQLHLVNHGARELHLKRITLWDFAHPTKGASQTTSLALHSGGSADMMQEFTIPREEYELWKRGTRPRLVLQTDLSNGRSGSEVLRLDRKAGGKVN
jgi:hypothetical protein